MYDQDLSFFQISTNMEGESRILAGEIWVATALVAEALADAVGDTDRHRACAC